VRKCPQQDFKNSPDRLKHNHTSLLRHDRIILWPRDMRHADGEVRHDIRIPDILVPLRPPTDRIRRRDSGLRDPFAGRVELVFDKRDGPDGFGRECCAFRDPAVWFCQEFRLLVQVRQYQLLHARTYLFRHDLVPDRLPCRIVFVVLVDKAIEMSTNPQPARDTHLQYRCRSVSTSAAASLAVS
jgi:hypothetical protein